MQINKGEDYLALTEDGAWCFFADPRAIYYEGKYQRTYIGWVTKNGDIMIAQYDHNTKKITQSIIRDKLEIDDHANPSIMIKENGQLIIFYSAHCGDKMYYRISKTPEEIDEWEEEKIFPFNTEGNHGYTYPTPIYLAKEDRIYLFWRGGNFKPCFSTTKDFKQWEEMYTLIGGCGARPYIKYETNGIDKIHFAFTDGHPNVETDNNIYHAYYQQGAFYKANGKKIGDINDLPIIPTQTDIVYDAKEHKARAWVWDIALDSNEYPCIVYATFPEDNHHHYRYARWDGNRWIDNKITIAGSWFPQTLVGKDETEPFYSGGIILDHQDPSVVYLSRQIDGIFEIERWVTKDWGNSWIMQEITRNSEYHNVRPVVPRNHREGCQTLWMNGEYVHYTQYKTALKIKP